MRPVNLIPLDQRKGAARAAGAHTAPVGVYALFGVLGIALLCVLALVLTTNKINTKTEELSKVQVKEQGAKQVADALRPYGTFAQIQQARNLEISALVSARFNWERALRQLSHAIPEDVWLLGLAGTLSPEIDVEDSGGGGDVTNLRQKAKAPAFAITGCTYSQTAVARMMTRMQNLDDVTDVQLAKSARKDEQEQGAGGPAVTESTDASAATQDAQDCVGQDRITKFEMLIVFGGARSASPEAAAGNSNPSSAAQAISAAQNAAATAQGASAQAGAAPAGGTTP